MRQDRLPRTGDRLTRHVRQRHGARRRVSRRTRSRAAFRRGRGLGDGSLRGRTDEGGGATVGAERLAVIIRSCPLDKKRCRVRKQFAIVAVTALLAGCGSSSTHNASSTTSASDLAPIHGRYAPAIDPANFVSTVDNPLWPLKPGTGFHFRGTRGTTPQTDDEIVTHRTKQILGVLCTVVRDTVSEHGHPVERTLDCYAQDKQGNVWYMGEDSFELQNGRFARASDSWLAGVDGAEPGIIMPAHPQQGDRYRQEYYPPGEALD